MISLAQEIKVCTECLGNLESESLKDFQDNFLCSDCSEKYYTVCNQCLSLVPADEAINKGIDAQQILSYCPNCIIRVRQQLPISIDEGEITQLVNEYIALHSEEKRVKDRLEEIKEQLKQIATNLSNNGEAVTLQGEEGAVKCTYKTSLKSNAEKVTSLRDKLNENVFAALFTEKVSFDVNKENFDQVLSIDSDLTEELRQQLEDAIKITETATLNVVKKR